ncbi:unnamed protein product, partial [Schistosoma mattheei]
MSSLYIIGEMLTTIDEISLLMSTVGLKFPLDNKRILSNYSFIGLQLLDYLIIGFRSSRWDKPKDNLSTTKKHNNSNKRYHSDSHECVSFLDKQLWILDLETNSSICGKSLCDHLNYFLNWGLTARPERIDWLILRGEIEFFVKNYRQALSTYLEFGSVVTDAFSKNVLSVFFTK